MLQIYLYGPKESGFLDLLPNAELDLESVSDIFDEDLSTGEFSLPIDIPWTEKNKRITGYAERLANFRPATSKSYKVVVYDSGFPELPAAQLIFIGKEGKFSYASGKSSATITGTKGLFGSKIKKKYLADLSLGGKITWQDMDSRQFAESLMKGNYPQYPFLTFVPVAIENFFDTGRSDYDDEFLARDVVNNVVITGAGADGWTFGRPQPEDPAAVITSGVDGYQDYRTIPFLKTKYILRKIFEENGFNVSGDFFSNPDYDALTTFNNYAIENYSPGHADYNRSIYLNNHVPKMLIIDWLKGVLPFFNLYPVFTGDNQVTFYCRKDLSKQKKVFSLTGLCGELFNSTVDQDSGDTSDGYKLTYDWGNDDYYSDRVKDLKDKNLVATVSTLADLSTVNAGRQLTTDDIALVLSQNIYYQVADGTSDPIKWDAYAEGLDEYVSGAGDRSVDMPISTLCTYVELQDDTQLYVTRSYLGVRMTGTYINNKGILVKSDCSNKIFFATRRYNSSNVNAPMSYNHNRDAHNNKINTYSLAWNTDAGMAAIFHTAWQAIRQNQEAVKTTITPNRRILAGIAASNYLEIDGILFLLSKTEKTIPIKSIMDIELVVG